VTKKDVANLFIWFCEEAQEDEDYERNEVDDEAHLC